MSKIDAASLISLGDRRMAVAKMWDFGSEGKHVSAVQMLDRVINDACALALATLKADLATAREETLEEVKGVIYDALIVSDDPGFVRGLSVAMAEVIRLLAAQPQPSAASTRMFPMTDGPDLPWSLAEEIYGSGAFDYFEQSRYLGGGNGLEKMAEGGGWSWRALADCFDTYSAQCEYESDSDTELEQRAEAFHAGDS